MPDRLPPIPLDAMTVEQREAAAVFKASRGAELFGPFLALVRSPELLTRVSAIGEYLRYRSALSRRLTEFAIIVTAAHWNEQYEWDLHSRLALKSGVALATIDAIAAGRRPEGMPDDEAILYTLCTEIHRDHIVSDDTCTRAVRTFGELGLVDAVGICGYSAMLAMVLTMASGPQPGGAKAQLRIPTR